MRTTSASVDDTPERNASPETHPPRNATAWLALGALGVVYGDIGTSPLYTMRECFLGPHAVPISSANVLGVLSLVFWSLTVLISGKYLTLVTRADNQGEGGILALLTLLLPAGPGTQRQRTTLILLGLFGAALLYGDGVITPAISVLSAVEGLHVATTTFDGYVVPLAVVILLALFAVQRRGTGGLAAIFGPAMLVWFATIGCLGVVAIVSQPQGESSVLRALDPSWGIRFFRANGATGFLVLGSVVLCVTGGEALYADMGHFGIRPIRLAWYSIALPGLLLSYFGQGALLLAHGSDVVNPFFELAPRWGIYPLVALSTAATIIASQALISGVFSLTQQATQLGYLPRFNIVHTSGTTAGQIYIPEVNAALTVGCVLLVLGFRTSSDLAGAYGIAVTGTMIVTTILFAVLARAWWKWPLAIVIPVVAVLLVFEGAFFAANLSKIFGGGWFPLLVGAVLFAVLTTWKRGRAELGRQLDKSSLPIEAFLAEVAHTQPHRIPGTAVVMTSTPAGVPPVLLHHFKHNKSLHERVVLVSILSERRPEVADADKVEIVDLGQGFYRVVARFGFMETPRIATVLDQCGTQGLRFELTQTSFVLGRETILTTGRSPLARWRKRLFVVLARNAPSAAAFFDIPPNRVIELGTQIEL